MKWLVVILSVMLVITCTAPVMGASGSATISPGALVLTTNKTVTTPKPVSTIANFSVLTNEVLATLQGLLEVYDVRVSGPINKSCNWTRIFFTTDSSLATRDLCEVKVEIVDADDHVLRTIRTYCLPRSDHSSGPDPHAPIDHYLDWDGKDDNGVDVPGGTYEVRVTATYTFYRYEREWGREGHHAGEFWMPQGIAVDRFDNVYVTDTGNSRVQKFSPDGSHMQTIEGGYMVYPYGIAINRTGALFVTDSYNRVVNLFSTAGYNLRYYNWTLNDPRGIAISPWDTMIIGDHVESDHDEIVMMSLGEEVVGNINIFDVGGIWSWEQALDMPSGVAIDADGDIVVTDTENDRIVLFNFDRYSDRYDYYYYDYYTVIGRRNTDFVENGNIPHIPGSGNSEFNQPAGVAVDGDGCFYVADTGNHRVQKFTPDGHYITQWGRIGYVAGEFNQPTGMAVDEHGVVYVVDHGNNRVQKFTPHPERASNSTTVQVSRGTVMRAYVRPSPRPTLIETREAALKDTPPALLSNGGRDPLGRQSVSLFVEMQDTGGPDVSQVLMSGSLPAKDATPNKTISTTVGPQRTPVLITPALKQSLTQSGNNGSSPADVTPTAIASAQASPDAPTGPSSTPPVANATVPATSTGPTAIVAPPVSGASWAATALALAIGGMSGVLMAVYRKR